MVLFFKIHNLPHMNKAVLPDKVTHKDIKGIGEYSNDRCIGICRRLIDHIQRFTAAILLLYNKRCSKH